MVSNPLKLVMAVLLFFLFLTYVRGVTIDSDPTNIVIQGDVPVAYGITFTNTSSVSVKPLIEVDGPLVVETSGTGEENVIPGNATKKLIVFLTASPIMKTGEVYVAQIRVTTPDNTMTIPLKVTKENAPILGPNPSPATGFVGLLSANAGTILNGFLIIVIVALLIGLFARIKHRMGK